MSALFHQCGGLDLSGRVYLIGNFGNFESDLHPISAHEWPNLERGEPKINFVRRTEPKLHVFTHSIRVIPKASSTTASGGRSENPRIFAPFIAERLWRIQTTPTQVCYLTAAGDRGRPVHSPSRRKYSETRCPRIGAIIVRAQKCTPASIRESKWVSRGNVAARCPVFSEFLSLDSGNVYAVREVDRARRGDPR